MKTTKTMARILALMLCIVQLVGLAPHAHVHALAESAEKCMYYSEGSPCDVIWWVDTENKMHCRACRNHTTDKEDPYAHVPVTEWEACTPDEGGVCGVCGMDYIKDNPGSGSGGSISGDEAEAFAMEILAMMTAEGRNPVMIESYGDTLCVYMAPEYLEELDAYGIVLSESMYVTVMEQSFYMIYLDGSEFAYTGSEIKPAHIENPQCGPGMWLEELGYLTVNHNYEDNILPGTATAYIEADYPGMETVRAEVQFEITGEAIDCDHVNSKHNGRGTNKNTTFTDNGDGTHDRSFDVYHYYDCDDCGQTYEKYIERGYETEGHYFEGGDVCVVCGGTGACPHLNIENWGGTWQPVEGEEWKDNGDGTHSALMIYVSESYCSDCHEYFFEKDETKQEVRTNSHYWGDDGVCGDCGAVNSCEHENINTWENYYPANGEEWKDNGDGTHSAVCYVEYNNNCRDCGYYWWVESDGTTVEYSEEHNWSEEGVCWSCGVVNTCKHERVDTWDYIELDKGEEWTDNGDGTHSGYGFIEYGNECYDCGYYWRETDESTFGTYTEEHSWDEDGTCWSCGAENTCEHPADVCRTYTNYDLADGDEWKDNGDGTHSAKVYTVVETRCSLCGQWETISRSETAEVRNFEHDFNDAGICYACGAENTCEHPEGEIDYFYYYDLAIGESWKPDDNGKTHSALSYRVDRAHCYACDMYWDVEREETPSIHSDSHYYEDGVHCFDCGYTNACEHPNMYIWKDYELAEGESWTINKDGTHTGVCYEFEAGNCEMCDAYIRMNYEETPVKRTLPHDFYRGECVYCGAENTCEHKNTHKATSYHFITDPAPDNGMTHTFKAEVYEIIWCNDCNSNIGEELVSSSKTIRQEHYFDNGVCWECGYEVECDHSKTEKNEAYSNAKNVEKKSSKKHIGTYDVYEVEHCVYCGSVISETLKEAGVEVEREHVFGDDGKCYECGYKNTCDHDGDTSKDYYYTDYKKGLEASEEGHTFTATKVTVTWCEDCGQVIKTSKKTGVEATEEHRFNAKGKCIMCGYISKDCFEHDWSNKDGECANCGAKCEHAYDAQGLCTICGAACKHEHQKPDENSFTNIVLGDVRPYTTEENPEAYREVHKRNFTANANMICEDCGVVVSENAEVSSSQSELHTVENGVCTVCGFACLEITKQPADVKAAIGEKGKITITAEGDELEYAWYFSDDDGATFKKSTLESKTYSITMKEDHDGRLVYCVVTDAYGNSLTSETVKMTTEKYAAITKQPVDATAYAGQDATVSVEATGDGITYTWYYKNEGKETYSKSSVTTPEYATTMSADRDGRTVYCLVKDEYGNSVKSDVITLTLRTDAAILTQPADASAANGEKVTVTMKAEGDGLTYAWFFSDDNGATFTQSSLANKTYSVTMNADRDGRLVYCVIADQYGNTIQSETVTLTAEWYADIVKQPVDTTAFVGEDAVVSVEAKGDGLTYTWYYKNAGKSSFSKSSVTTPEYATTMSEARDGRQIYCKVTDKYGNSTNSDVVTVSIKYVANITTQPVSKVVSAGKSATFKVVAEGDGKTYTWYYRNAGEETFTKSSVTKASYTTTMSESRDGREIYCEVADQYGNVVKSDVVTITLPKLKITTQPTSKVAVSDESVTFKVVAEGDGKTYEWYYSDDGVEFKKSTVTKSSYTTTMKASRDGRQIYCIVKDAYGASEKSDVVTLALPELKITSQPASKVVSDGDSATFKVKAEGDGLEYAWYYSDDDGATFKKSTVTKSSYTTTMKASRDGRQIYCIVTDSTGASETSAVVTLTLPKLKITSQPKNRSAESGESVTFKVSAEGDGLKYVWYYKDADDSDYTKSSVAKASYTTTVKESRDGRKVYCLITDAYGNSVKSDVVTMTVEK